MAPTNDQEVQEVVNHNDLLHLSDMIDLNVENKLISTNLSNCCDACLDHCPELNDNMIRVMNDLLDMTLEFEITQLRPQSELHTLDDSMPPLRNFNGQSLHINSSPIVCPFVFEGQEQASMHPSTSNDNGILGQIITDFDAGDESLSVDCLNPLATCVAHFVDSNDLMIHEIVDASQDSTR